jgi:hypothetical protein
MPSISTTPDNSPPPTTSALMPARNLWSSTKQLFGLTFMLRAIAKAARPFTSQANRKTTAR